MNSKNIIKLSALGLLVTATFSYKAIAGDVKDAKNAAVSIIEQSFKKVLINANDELPDWFKRVEFEWEGRNEQRHPHNVQCRTWLQTFIP